MHVEILLASLVIALMALGLREIRRPDCGAVTLWVTGWVAAGAGAILMLMRDAFPSLHLLSYPLGSLFPALLVAGALTLSGRARPRWLLPAALTFGLLRATLAVRFGAGAAHGASLAVEPLVVLAAGWIVWRATARNGVSTSERLLAPSFVVLAVVGAVHVSWLMRSPELPAGLYALWVLSVPPLLGVQMQADASRARRALERARGALEARVEARTAELVRLTESLREEIGERRTAEAALRESEERHRVLSALGSDVTFAFQIGPGMEVRGGWINDAFARMTGFTLEDLAGSGWRALVYPDDRESHGRQLDAVVAGLRHTIESRISTRDGRILTFASRLQVRPDPEHGIVHLLGAGRDVTEERRIEQEQRQLEQRMRETQRLESIALLAGGIAHDFNNLLAVILGNTRLALADLGDASALQQRLARIRTAAEHGARLTEQMLVYSGRSQVARKPIDLSHLVEEMADILRASVTERCRLELALEPLAAVEGDGTQLRQVLLNLVGNASEALEGKTGTVTVRTGVAQLEPDEHADAAADARPGTHAFVEVTDDGVGMDEATRTRIFEPFFSTRAPGRGLGLAAVLGIVRAHGGTMKVRSERGRGTSIGVYIPSLGGVGSGTRSAPPEPTSDVDAGLVLVVDDDALVLEVAQAFLERAGFRVRTALGGREGIERFRAGADEIALVVLDLAMPDADGEQVLRELRRERPGVPVIIASGYSATLSAERLARLGATGFVRKPYSPEELVAQVRHALAPGRDSQAV